MTKPKFEIPDISNWIIPLRYYKGWTIDFNVARETFACPLLCLYSFDSVKDLEKAIDRTIIAETRRNNKINK
jgi:hypothetical protein